MLICRCGEAECLSFTGTSCEICGNDIYMDICVADYGHNRFHFKKEQYTDSVLNILYILKEKAEHDSERQVSYLMNTYLSLEEIDKFIGYYKKWEGAIRMYLSNPVVWVSMPMRQRAGADIQENLIRFQYGRSFIYERTLKGFS